MAELYDSSLSYDFAGYVYDQTFSFVFQTASGSGLGSSASTPLRIVLRNGDSSGVGSATCIGSRVIKTTASGFGSGSSISDGNRQGTRSATGRGFGSGSADCNINPVRTASGSAVGTGVATYFETLPRTAAGAGSSASGTVLWTKSLIFRPPIGNTFPWADYRKHTPEHELFGYVRKGSRAQNVYLLTDGTFTNVDPLNPDLVEKTYLGGHDIWVTQQEKDVLVGAGFTVT